MDEKRVRVRLKFEEPGVLTSQQIEHGLAQSWYLVLLEDVHTVADVAFDIRAVFHLEESCPNGLSLESGQYVSELSLSTERRKWGLLFQDHSLLLSTSALDSVTLPYCRNSTYSEFMWQVDGFALPASQPARLLKDSDLIRIKRKTDIRGQNSHKGRNIYDHIPSREWLEQCSLGPCKVYPSGSACPGANGLQRVRRGHGVELGALDEFEKETGGYESEQEKGEMETDISLDGELETSKDTKLSPTCRKEKDRGRKTQKRIDIGVSEVGISKRARGLEAGQEVAVVQVKNKCNSVLNCGATESLGVELHSLDELGKETGNDEEKNRTGAVFSGEGKCIENRSEAASPSPLSKQERREKKRKAKEANIEGEGRIPHQVEEVPSSNGVHFTVEHVNDNEQKVKRKKLKHSGSNPLEADCRDELREGITSSGKKKKKKDSSSLSKDDGVMEGMSKKGTAVHKVGGKKRKKEADLDSPAGKLSTSEIEAGGVSVVLACPAATQECKVNGESTLARTPKHKTNATVQEQRPSRSARRKKAKRQWLREQAQMALVTGVDTAALDSNRSEVQIAQGELVGSPVGEEVLEVEAEEEMLPVIVRPGYIRFEPYDKDEMPDQSRPSMPVVQLADQLKTKRQGQNWGQERSAGKHQGGKRWPIETSNVQVSEASGDTRVDTRSEHRVDPASFGMLPALDGAPQQGDVLAYRLVELTASWTPEISPYRVGIVSHWENPTNVIKVDPHPGYPCPGKNAPLEDEEDNWNVQETGVVGPYDENGVLEIEFSSLVEVRLMERVHSENQEAVPGAIVEIGKELDPTTAAAHRVEKSTREPIADIVDSTLTGEQHDVEDGDRTESPSAWQALVLEEIERKKMELRQSQVVDTNTSEDNTGPSEQLEDVTVGSEGGVPLHQPKADRGRKHKYLRSAGVGSIVAFLRAQQAL